MRAPLAGVECVARGPAKGRGMPCVHGSRHMRLHERMQGTRESFADYGEDMAAPMMELRTWSAYFDADRQALPPPHPCCACGQSAVAHAQAPCHWAPPLPESVHQPCSLQRETPGRMHELGLLGRLKGPDQA